MPTILSEQPTKLSKDCTTSQTNPPSYLKANSCKSSGIASELPSNNDCKNGHGQHNREQGQLLGTTTERVEEINIIQPQDCFSR